jgi:mono/diheme cytochrome c family protein
MKSRISIQLHRSLFILPAIIIAVVAGGYGFTSAVHQGSLGAAKSVPVDTAKKGAMIKVDEDTYDFHDIEQGTKAEHVFILGNSGTDTLVITGEHPSCGCTAAVIDGSPRVPPGGTAHMRVTFDANNKPEGPIIKSVTISSNSIDGGSKMVRIQGRVVKSKLAHKTTMHLDGLFQGDCASCHVAKGKGELGARLYEADCAICHGLKSDGKPGPELAADAMMKHSPKQWQTITENGIPNTGMPAFHSRNKGPLGDEEIASLVEYMGAFKKEAQRNNQLKSLAPKTGGASSPGGMNAVSPAANGQSKQ